MNIEELEEELGNVLPAGFEIGTDNNGQIVIYTGLREDEDGELVAHGDEDSDEDEDLDVDPDFEPLDDEEDEDDE